MRFVMVAAVGAHVPMRLVTSHARPLQDLPAPLRENIEKWRDMNTDFDFRYFDDAEQRIFMRDRCAVPGCFEAYSMLVSGAARADMFRVAYMYFEGGFWFDADVKAGSLADRCGIGARDARNLFLVREPKRGHVRFMVIGGFSHPLLKANIYRQIANVVAVKAAESDRDGRRKEAGALKTTGPFTLGRTLCNPFEFATPADLVEENSDELREEAKEIGLHCGQGYFTGLSTREQVDGVKFLSRDFGTDRMSFRYDTCEGYWHRPGARGLSYQLMLKAMNVTHHLQSAA